MTIDRDTQEYRERSSSLKFRQNLVQGLGAAMVFGVAAAGGTALFTAAKAAAASGFAAVLPYALGIAAVIAIGIGCLYVASKYYAESVRLDQIHQAKQITRGINGKVPEIEQKPISFPAQDKPVETAAPTTLQSAANDNRFNEAQPTVSQVTLDNKVVPLDAAKVRA